MNRITVFCGASMGKDPIFEAQAKCLGQQLAQANIGLVYGGAKIGLMGAVADGALQEKGEVIGVLPNFLGSREIAHEGLTELIMVETMHERKTLMNDLCDGVIALPGGFGTMEELFEMLTWGQLGLHQKPIGLLNTDNYYDPFISFLTSMVERGFLRESNLKMVLISSDIEDLLKQMNNYNAPEVDKIISRETT